jgi:hypothetical protein
MRRLAFARAILYKPGFPGRPAPHHERDQEQEHGRPETKNIALAARDAPFR